MGNALFSYLDLYYSILSELLLFLYSFRNKSVSIQTQTAIYQMLLGQNIQNI